MKMVNPLWDFFQIPFNKMESNACPKQMKNQETLVSKIGKLQNGYSPGVQAGSSPLENIRRGIFDSYYTLKVH